MTLHRDKFTDVSQLVQIATEDAVEDIRYVPEHFQMEVARYIWFGVRPGLLLTKVFANDLHGAMMVSARHNLSDLQRIALFVHVHCPAPAKGSAQAVNEWCAKHEEQAA